MFRTIRFRLALWYAVAFLLSSGIIAWIVYLYVGQTLSDRLDQSLTNESEWIVARVERGSSHAENIADLKDDIFDHASFYPIKEYIEVWVEDTLFFHSPNLAQDTLREYCPARDTESEMLTVTNFRDHDIRLAIRKMQKVLVLLAMPTGNVTAPVHQLVNIFLWLCPVVIIVAVFGGMYVARKSLARLNHVVDTARQITIDRLHNRIPEYPANDEVGTIVSTFNQMISRLDVSFAQMKQFSADASHELLTPLSVLRSQLETALNSRVEGDEMKKIIADCLDETLHMTSILGNLLLLAQGDAKSIVTSRDPVDLTALMNEMHEESVVLASQKSITVSVNIIPGVTITGDRPRLRQMLLNLIDNAIKYNQVHGSIHLGLQVKDGNAVITVRDTGIGMSENEIPKIFNRFYRVDRARSRELGGAGLGLSIVKWIVDAHNGTISVISKVNGGTEFLVSFPLDPLYPGA